MVRPHAGDRGTNGRGARSRPRTPQQRSTSRSAGNRASFTDERAQPCTARAADDAPRPDAPHPEDPRTDAPRVEDPRTDDPRVEPPAPTGAEPDADGGTEPVAERKAAPGADPPLDVILEMTKGDGPIAGSARALGIALLAAMGLVLAGVIALVIWAVTVIF